MASDRHNSWLACTPYSLMNALRCLGALRVFQVKALA